MNFKSTFWGVILIVLGSLLLIDKLLPNFSLERYVLPILLIIGGMLLIFKDSFKNNSNL